MTDNPLYISFLWHMHQPYYKDPVTGLYKLPWVRLHGTKDYLDMIEILSEFPDIRQTFNFTPSLLEQITDYAQDRAQDSYMELSLKTAADLTGDERIFILENFFLANWENMIRPFPRYYELLAKRGTHVVKNSLGRIARYFSDGEFLDLQVLFNLCWIDPLLREKDPFLTMLAEKGREYSEEDKHMLIAKQVSLLKEIIPRYREMARKGRIELSVSPFYHPILPLLCDTNSARIAMPEVNLPQKRFSHPEDAEKQITMGIEYFEKLFGYRPAGMWPSEGSVSEEVLRLADHAGIQWVGTDEDILAASMGIRIRDDSRNLADPSVLYKPYVFGNVSIIFRDHYLSDLIGFVYSGWDAKKAAGDLINKFIHAWSTLPKNRTYLLSVILDGENAWEHYKNDGADFLRYLYEGLSKDERLSAVTVSEYLNVQDRGDPLTRLHTGSWIYANFGVWIGHEEDNRAWDYLSETRQELEIFRRTHPERDLSEAFRALFIAEGSDWNWWYGDDHETETQKDFDELFRANLMKVYSEMGRDIPEYLFIPVLREDRGISPAVGIRGFIDPKIDGAVTNYYEWYQAARMDIRKSGGSMHKSESILSGFYYGFNKDALFLRLDPAVAFDAIADDTRFCIHLLKPSQLKVDITIRPSLTAVLLRKINGEWEKIKDLPDVAFRDIFEIALPFADLLACENDEISLFISITKNGGEMERCPWRGYISLTVPTPDFEAMMWL
jgi:alpha-amylase/alpha-mannosidase (GH57 family)